MSNTQHTSLCSKCAESYHTAKYFTRRDDDFVHSQCMFCRFTKAELTTHILEQDDRLSDMFAKVTKLQHSYDKATTRLIRADSKLQDIARNPHVCDDVKRENDDLHRVIAAQRLEMRDLEVTASKRIDHETAELRKELKTLRRSAKKARQKAKKRQDIVQPPTYCADEDELPEPPPMYNDVV